MGGWLDGGWGGGCNARMVLDLMTAKMVGKGVMLGLAVAVPMGPVNVEIARRALRQGFKYGTALGGGASTVDMVYATVACLGWAPLISKDTGPVMYVLGTAGVLFLLYLATMCLRGAWQGIRPKQTEGEESVDAGTSKDTGGAGVGGTYVTGLLMNFLNPMVLAFWFLALPATAVKLTDSPGRDLPWICAGVFVGAFGWVVGFSGVVSALGRFKRGLWVVMTDAAGGIVLLGFAAVAAGRMLKPWLFP